MDMSGEGYIKFDCRLTKTGQVIPDALYGVLTTWRNQLYSRDLLGADEWGIGFGNLSARKGNTRQFYISGSTTGRFRFAEPGHYVLVTAYSFVRNSVACRGPVKASSESLSHAAIYEADKSIQSVIHVHHRPMWDYGLDRMPVTDPALSFGTPEIAQNISALLKNDRIRNGGILVMGGHPDGLLFFGRSPDDAGNHVLNLLERIANG